MKQKARNARMLRVEALDADNSEQTTVKEVIRDIRKLEEVMWTAQAESMGNFAIAHMLDSFASRLEDALRRMGVECPTAVK